MNEFQPLPISVKQLWYAGVALASVIIMAVASSIDVGVRASTDIDIPPLVMPATFTVLVCGPAAALVGMTWRRWGFQLTEDWIRVRHGVLTHHEEVIPRNRVQTVSTENGPLDRLLSLTSVKVHTAGVGSPTIAIPHLADEVVEWLRSELGRGVHG